MNVTRLLLVEDHQIISDGLKRLLNAVSNIEVVSDVSNSTQALGEIQRTQPDLVVTDLSMPGLDGFALIDLITRKFPQTKILVLTVHEHRDYVQKAINLRVNGYLLKDISIDELIKAINTVMRGGFYFHKKVLRTINRIVQSKKLTGSNTIFQLTVREKEILRLILDGLNSTNIARKLFISVRTVQNHRARIMKKAGAKNTAELVKLAIKKDIL